MVITVLTSGCLLVPLLALTPTELTARHNDYLGPRES